MNDPASPVKVRFNDPILQKAYAHARKEGVPRAGSSIYCAYLDGLGVRSAPPMPRNSIGYAWWRAGRDNRDAKTLGERDRETLIRLGIPLPEWAKQENM